MLDGALDHLIHNTLPAADDYAAAESALSRAHVTGAAPVTWEAEARHAKRRAAELAIAIDGLTDRCCKPLNSSRSAIRTAVEALCVWPGSASPRMGCIERMRGVANAYKHYDLHDATLPIASADDVLVVALGFGLDGWGVGKFGSIEVIVREKSGQKWKFLGDAPLAMIGWFRFLGQHGVPVPSGPYRAFNPQIHP
jgi:hypothetical protein